MRERERGKWNIASESIFTYWSTPRHPLDWAYKGWTTGVASCEGEGDSEKEEEEVPNATLAAAGRSLGHWTDRWTCFALSFSPSLPTRVDIYRIHATHFTHSLTHTSSLVSNNCSATVPSISTISRHTYTHTRRMKYTYIHVFSNLLVQHPTPSRRF